MQDHHIKLCDETFDVLGWYKKINISEYQYEIHTNDSKNDIKNVDAAELLSAVNMTSDELTGYYLADKILPIGKNLVSFHVGMNSDGITRGIWSALKKYKWRWYGCDKKCASDLYKKISLGKYDIYGGLEVIQRINEKFGIDPFDFYISDIKCHSAADLLAEILVGLSTTKSLLVVRLPDHLVDISQISGILACMITIYKSVIVSRPPWSPNKYYLILQDRCTKTMPYMFLMNYLNDLKKYRVNLLKKSDIIMNIAADLQKIYNQPAVIDSESIILKVYNH